MQTKSTMPRNHARRAPHYPRGSETSRRLLCLLLFPARQPAGVGDEAASRQSKMTASPDQPDFERVMSVRQLSVNDALPADIGDGRRN